MYHRGSSQLILVMGLVACSNAAFEAPTAESQLSVTTLYQATSDAVILKTLPTANFGGATTCGATGDQLSSGRSCLMRFNVPQMVNITVNSAWLDLRVTDISLQAFAVYPVASDWVENEVTWNRVRAGFPWQVAGALGLSDRGPSLGEHTFIQTDDTLSLNLLNGGLQLVQSWFNDPLHNYGVIVADDLNDDRVLFATREHATPEYRPTLHVEYTLNQGGGGGSSGTGPGTGGNGTGTGGGGP